MTSRTLDVICGAPLGALAVLGLCEGHVAYTAVMGACSLIYLLPGLLGRRRGQG